MVKSGEVGRVRSPEFHCQYLNGTRRAAIIARWGECTLVHHCIDELEPCEGGTLGKGMEGMETGVGNITSQTTFPSERPPKKWMKLGQE